MINPLPFRRLTLIFCAGIFLGGFSGAVSAQEFANPVMFFLTQQIDPQATGAGEAGTAGHSGLPGIMTNPAHLLDIRHWDIFQNKRDLGSNADGTVGYYALGGAWELDKTSVFGIYMQRYNYGNYSLEGSDGGVISTRTAYEMALGVAYGKRWGQKLQGAAQFNYLRNSFYNDAANTFAVNLGLSAKHIFPWLTFRFGGTSRPSVQNLKRFAPRGGISLGVSLLNTGPAVEDPGSGEDVPLPQRMRFGLAYRFLQWPHSNLTLYSDMLKPLVKPGDSALGALVSGWSDSPFQKASYHLGSQLTVFYFLSVRYGMIYNPEFTNSERTRYTVGLGLDFRFFSVTYGEWLDNGNASSELNQSFILGFRLGGIRWGE
ncbi:MAG: PorV/PorQ family protein [Calditrichaeota bacterium]|nr:PorV/PorQ family protein [Calditrichota bacterium]HQU73436.1 PorV/PorQ family protein [Calditrichia bacterium]